MKRSATVTLLTLAASLLLGATIDFDRRDATIATCPPEQVFGRSFPVSASEALEVAFLEREALLLFDRSHGVTLVERDADTPRIVASTVKMLTALTVLRHASPEELVVISRTAAATAGASIGVRAGEQHTVAVLLAGLLGRSGNDAAVALAEHVSGDVDEFVRLMRQEAVALGLDSAVINDPTGLADSNRLSARQLGMLADHALSHPVIAQYVAAQSIRLPDGSRAQNRNLLLERYSGATGVKTGFTTRAGHAVVASARRDGRELIAVVLAAGSAAARFARAEQLLDFGFDRTAARELASTLRWETSEGESVWQIPATTFVGGSQSVSLRWSLPTTPFDAVQVDLLIDQQRLCRFRSVPMFADTAQPQSLGELLRGVVSQGHGAAVFSETSGSLRVPVQGGHA